MVAPARQLPPPPPPPPPPPINPLLRAVTPPRPLTTLQAAPAQTYAAAWHAPAAPARAAPTPAPTPAPAPSEQGGIGGFFRGLAQGASHELSAVKTAVTSTASAATQVGGSLLRGGANVLTTSVQSTVASVGSRLSGTASVIGAEVRGAASVAGHAITNAASITGSFARGVGQVTLARAFDPASAPAVAARAAGNLSSTVSAAGSDMAHTVTTAGTQVAQAQGQARLNNLVTDARGASSVVASVTDTGMGVARSVVQAGGTLASGAVRTGMELAQAGQTFSQTFRQAGSDLLDVGKAIAKPLIAPFDFSHHTSTPVTPPGGLGTQVGGIGTPQDVWENAVAAGNSYDLPTNGQVGTPMPANMHVMDVQNNAADALEVQNALGLTPRMLEGGDAVPGFRAQVYRTDTPTGPSYTVAFAGTDPMQLSDLVTDGKQAFGADTAQYHRAIEIGSTVAARTAGTNVQVDFAGHSLGGGLAAAAAVASGKNADTFNAAGLHQTTIAEAQAAARANHVTPGVVNNYRVQGEPLTAVSEVSGLRGLIGGAAGYLLGGPGGFIAGEFGGANIPVPAGYGNQHDMTAVTPPGGHDFVVNRHMMDFVLASVQSAMH